MLKKRVADRPQSAQEVLKDLADRPLIAVPIAGVETDTAVNPEQHIGGPAIVRTLATPQTVLPRGKSPLTSVGDQATGRSPAAAKSASAAKMAKTGVRPPERFSKDWFNQQLGRPYVLYPLCGVIILGTLWFSFGRSSGGPPAKSAAAKKPEPPKPIVLATISVKFDAGPDSSSLEVAEGEVKQQPTADGKYALQPGHHTFTFRKSGFQPLTTEFDISAEHNTFPVKLEPIIKSNDVTIQVTPANAELKIDGASQSLVNGAHVQKLEEGKPLEIDARLDGYEPIAHTFAAAEIAKLGNKIAIALRAREAAFAGVACCQAWRTHRPRCSTSHPRPCCTTLGP